MPAYWWSCAKCGGDCDFAKACDTPDIHGFIWNKLLLSDWDQALLGQRCAKCRSNSLRITYEFPREDKEVVMVNHIVGLNQGTWLPMMWETVLTSEPKKRLYDFKYVGRRNTWGLNKPAVFTEGGLRDIFRVYREKTGRAFQP